MFVSNCSRCHLRLNLTSFVLNVSKSCMLCPLSLTQSDFFVKYGHGSCIPRYSCHFTSPVTIK
ncbi:hypothetical protein Hanom_Chr14g01253861 [Helianthus anomalus]